MGFSDDQLLARETPDLRPPAQGLSDEDNEDLLRREGLAAPRAKPEPPHVDTAGEQYARGLAAGHFKDDEETPLTRTLRAGQQQMDEPDSGYMNRALNAWQAMAAQGAGEVAKVGANALGIETGPAEQFAGEAMSASPGLMGAEGAPHPREAMRARPVPQAESIPPPRAEPIPPRMPEAPSGRPAGEPIPPALSPAPPSAAKTALVNIAQGKPADAPPAAEVAPPAAQPRPETRAPAATVGGPETAPVAPLTVTPEATPGMWPEPVVDSRQGQQMAPATAPTIAPGESAPRPTPAKRVVQGLNVNIENPQGSLRTGTGDNGTPWQVHMPADYGEIVGTRGADGSPVDAYVGPHPESRRAFVVDQYDPQGNFDEHKVVLAARTAKDATAIYDAGFSDGSGPARRGAITEVPISRLKAWLQDGDTTAAFAGSQHAAPPAPKEPPVRRPANLAEFLARSGGIARDPGGDLVAMDLHKQFVPGAGMLVRKNGRPLDYAREIAEEAGYLPKGSTTADLLDELDRNRRGDFVFSNKDTGDVVAWKDQELGKNRASRAEAQVEPEAEEERPPAPPERHELESRAEGLGIERHGHLSDEELLAEIHEREAMMVEGDAMEPHVDRMKAEFDAAEGEALPGEDYDEIPGFEGPVGSPRRSASDAETGEQLPPIPGEEEGGEGAGEIGPGDSEGPPKNRGPRDGLEERPRQFPSYTTEQLKGALARVAPDLRAKIEEEIAARESGASQVRVTPQVERTAQGNQIVMPGMERSARQAQASREDAGRGKIVPTKPQKPADEGLFAKPGTPQPDMFDKAQRDAAHANAEALRQAWATAKADTEAPLHDDFARFAATRGGMPTTPLAARSWLRNTSCAGATRLVTRRSSASAATARSWKPGPKGARTPSLSATASSTACVTPTSGSSRTTTTRVTARYPAPTSVRFTIPATIPSSRTATMANYRRRVSRHGRASCSIHRRQRPVRRSGPFMRRRTTRPLK